jgi:hypothetical protein
LVPESCMKMKTSDACKIQVASYDAFIEEIL